MTGKGAQHRRLRRVVFEYLWPFWLFRDACSGSDYERAAAYRHNLAQSRWLPRYALRWAVMAMFLLAVNTASDHADDVAGFRATVWSAIATGTGIAFALASVVLVVILTAWFRLRHGD